MKIRASIRCVVEVTLSQGWGENCSATQIKSQAIESFKDALRGGLVIQSLKNANVVNPTEAELVTEPIVTAIMVDL